MDEKEENSFTFIKSAKISKEMNDWLEKKNINFSKYVRSKLDEDMIKEPVDSA